MYNTMRTIIFILSGFLIFIVYPFIQKGAYLFLFTTLGFLSPTYFLQLYVALVLILGFIAFAGLQAIIRTLLLNKYLKGQSAMDYPITGFSLSDHLIYYIVPFLVHLLPLFKRFQLNEIIIMKIGLFIITLFIFHVILKLSKKSTRVYFMKEGLLIRGLDLRLDFPLPAPFFNASGYYPYSKLQHYLLRGSTVEFKLPAESGKIIFSFSSEEQDNIKQFLMMLNIPQGNINKEV